MDVATQLTEHLQALNRQPDTDSDPDDLGRVRQVAAGLAWLARDLVAEVPSCLSVAIVLSPAAGGITVSVPAATLVADGAAVVRASLAIPLRTAAGGSLLLLHAADAGAFVLLADDLAAQRDAADPPLLVDQHLVVRTDPDGSRLAADLADLRAIEQAVGVLIDQGWLPSQARQELSDRARDAQLPAPRLARQLLAALPGQAATSEPP